MRQTNYIHGPGRLGESVARVAEPASDPNQVTIAFPHVFPEVARNYPQLRFMGSKFRLLPWLHSVLNELDFETAVDAFSGSGCVSYLLKAMDKQVFSNDFLNMSATITTALIENSTSTVSEEVVATLLEFDPQHKHFIERTFSGIFFTPQDLRFLDRISWNIRKLADPWQQALTKSALIRSCAKRQPRGVFTVAGDPEHYKDDRRDLRLSLQEHFLEQIQIYNRAVFDNGKENWVRKGDVFGWEGPAPDLVYLDPPYVPRADDNCYMKRYHFLEGLSCYWEGLEIMPETRVRKIKKPFTAFSYRKGAVDAFDRLFRKFADSTLVLSYSSNGFPDLSVLVDLMERYKTSVQVHEHAHRYHFGTHRAVERAQVQEYLIVGRS